MRRVAVGVLASAAALVLVSGGWGGGASTIGVPRGFKPETAAVVGTRDLWVLGSQVLLRSTDAGRHFRQVAEPPLQGQGSVPTVVFADRNDGFAYIWRTGPLYVTHDGGSSWHRAVPDQPVAAFAIAGGYAYAVFGRSRLERATVSGGTWEKLPFLVKRGFPVSLAARGANVWLLGVPKHRHQDDSDELVRSTDRGRTFSAGPGPCFSELGGSLEPAAAGVVWAVCPTGNFSQTHRSANRGRSFRVVRTPGQTNGASVEPFSRSGALLDRGVNGPLYRTADDGAHWEVVPGMRRFDDVLWLAFTTRGVGAALVQTTPRRTELWRTTDGGATWRNIPITG